MILFIFQFYAPRRWADTAAPPTTEELNDMNQNHDHDSDLKIIALAMAQMDQDIRSDLLDKMVQLAIERGSEKVRTFRGSGYLHLKHKPLRLGYRTPEMYRVAYEIDVLLNPVLMHADALGSMVGDHSVIEHAMSSGDAQLRYAAERAPADIRIIQLEANQAYFTVLSRFGI
jgi:hypothetical protein